MTATHLFGAIAVAVIVVASLLILLISWLLATLAKHQRQRAEARETRQRLADVVELAADWVWETDGDDRFVYFSKRFEEVTGLPESNFLGRSRMELAQLDGFDSEEWDEHLDAVRGRRPFRHFRYSFTAPDGTRHVFQVSGKPIFDRHGRYAGYRGTGSDLSETMNARAAADAAEAHAREVLDSALDPFFSIDSDGVVRDWNRAAEVTFGWTRAEAIGRPADCLVVPGAELDANREMMAHLRAGDAWFLNHRVRTTARTRDGTVFPCELAITETRTEHGRTFNAFMRDITEREAHQAAMEAARREAELASKSKSEFLAAMSHELRTPLNAVIGFSDLLASQPDIPEAQRLDYLKDIRDSGHHLLELINDVLDLSKIEAGRLDLAEDAVDPAEVCDACLRVLRERADSGGVRLVRDIPADLPAVVADRTRLKQVLLNLLSNAVKFTERGGTVTVFARKTEEGGVCLAVADTGIGMAEEELARAFEPFAQLDNVYSRRQQGTGLGLALAQTLSELHGGRLEVDTAPGVGTTAACVLPPERLLPEEVAAVESEARLHAV